MRCPWVLRTSNIVVQQPMTMSRKCCTMRSCMLLLLRLLHCHRHTKPVKLSGGLQLFLSHRSGHRATKYFPSHPFSASCHLARATVLPGSFQRPLLHRNVLRTYFQKLAQACVTGQRLYCDAPCQWKTPSRCKRWSNPAFPPHFCPCRGHTRRMISLCGTLHISTGHAQSAGGLWWCSCRCRHLRKTSTRPYRSFCYRKSTKSCKHAKQASQAKLDP